MASTTIKRTPILLILICLARGLTDYGRLTRENPKDNNVESEETGAEGSGWGDTLKTSALYGVGLTAATITATAGVEYADTLYNEYSDKTAVLKKMWSCKSKLETPDLEQCQNQAIKNYCSTAVCESAVWDAWFTSTYSNADAGDTEAGAQDTKRAEEAKDESNSEQETNDEIEDEISEGEKTSECADMCKKSKQHCTACQMMMDSCSSECPKKCAACAQLCLPFAPDFDKEACNTCNTNTNCESCQTCIGKEYKKQGKSSGENKD